MTSIFTSESLSGSLPTDQSSPLLTQAGKTIQPYSVLICGYDDLAALIVHMLHQLGRNALIIDLDLKELSVSLVEGTQVVRADYRSIKVLQQLGVEQAKVILLLNNDDQRNFEMALLVRDLNPRARIISRLFNLNLGKYFDQRIPNHFSMSTSALVSPAFALRAVSDEFLGYFALPRLQDATSNGSDPPNLPTEETTLWNIVDLTIGPQSRLLRVRLEELEETFQVRVLFHYPVDQLADFSQVRVFGDFDYGAQLVEGDQLIVVCDSRNYLQLRERNGQKTASRAQRWAAGQAQAKDPAVSNLWQSLLGWKQTINAWSNRISPFSRLIGLTLGVMLGLGIAAFMMIGKSPLDALFATIVALREGYGNIGEIQLAETPLLVKVIAVGISLVGTAFVALLYGFLTDKLLSIRFGLGKGTRIPKSDHVVVVGVGKVGFRILKLLKEMGYEVVGIDNKEDNPFIEAARQEGIPVVIGDSTLLSNLNQCNIVQGRCLICSTTNDLANLETALTAHSVNPALRTVLRIFDPRLAERIQRHFPNLGASYSLSSLAAPAFATAALVGSVYGTIQWEDQILLVTLLQISPRSLFLGMTLRELMHSYDVVVLTLQPVGQPEILFPPIGGDSADAYGLVSRSSGSDQRNLKLNGGDRLYILASSESISRITRRRPLPVEVYRVQLLACENAYFEKDIAEAIAFYARQPVAEIRPLLKRLPAIVSPPLPRDKALKLARQLKKMSTDVKIIAETIDTTASA